MWFLLGLTFVAVSVFVVVSVSRHFMKLSKDSGERGSVSTPYQVDSDEELYEKRARALAQCR